MSNAIPTYPTIKYEGTSIDSITHTFNFTGPGVSVVQTAAGAADIIIPGGGGGGSVSGETNGVSVSVTNDSNLDVHSYTVSETDLSVGTEITYKAKLTASNSDGTPISFSYRTDLMIGAVPFGFNLEQPEVTNAGQNTRGDILGVFQIVSDGVDTFLEGEVTINCFDPDNFYTATYESTQFCRLAFDIGVDSLTVFSEIQSNSVDSTLSLVGSSLTIIS